MTRKAFRGLFFCAVLGAFLFRAIRLELRPMHPDEANQAVKFGGLLERGEYRYDPNDHHGPSLYYLTLPVARVLSGRSLAAADETVLRLVPALFGTGLLLLFLLFAGGLGRETIAAAAVLAAVTPSLTYYSRFYIQETLLVFFLAGLLAAGWRYLRTRSGWWAAAGGFAAGMMYATKETSIILFGALAAAALADRLLRPKAQAGPSLPSWKAGNVIFHAVVFLAAAFVPAWLLFTSLLKNPGGLADSLRAFGLYVQRAGGSGLHAQPWTFYVRTLLYARYGHGPVWSEAFIVALAAAGSIFAFRPAPGKDGHSRLARIIFFFTVITLAAYSIIPYKTPWNALPFDLGLVVLAGIGAGRLLQTGRLRITTTFVLAVLVLGFLNLCYQDYRANLIDYANPTNPYVYAQTSPDFLKLVNAIEGVAAVSSERERTLIKVVASPEETWPLPWYLRRFERVGYWTDLAAAGDLADAPVVITSAGFAEAAGQHLDGRYESAFYGLRPEVVLSLFVRQDLWDAYLRSLRSTS